MNLLDEIRAEVDADCPAFTEKQARAMLAVIEAALSEEMEPSDWTNACYLGRELLVRVCRRVGDALAALTEEANDGK